MSHRGHAHALLALLLATLAAPTGAQDIADFVAEPVENPHSPDKALLGKFLFWEEQVGGDNTVACGTCHIPELGGGDPRVLDADSVHPGFDATFGTADDVRGSKGVVSFEQLGGDFLWEDSFFPRPQVTGRLAPTVLNVGLSVAPGNSVGLFWDGRADTTFVDPQSGDTVIVDQGSLESQAVAPPLSTAEMAGAGQTWGRIAGELASVTPMALAADLPPDMAAHLAVHPTYPDMFAAAFGSPAITARRIAFAIADYERTLLSDQTPFDLHFRGEQPIPPELDPGLDIFMGACHVCHLAPFTIDWSFHNLGVQPDEADPGRMAVTGDPTDLGKFKTAQLRNVGLRSAYFHDGSRTSLEEVVDFYSQGGGFNTNGLKDGILVPLQMSEQEKADLVLFLEQGLTDPRVAAGTPPFDRPTLGSEAAATNVLYGAATAGPGGVEPRPLVHVPANTGNPDFKLGLYDAPVDRKVFLAFGFDPAPPTPVAGILVNIDLSGVFLILPLATDTHGVATVTMPIPPNPNLAGVTVFANWAVMDAAETAFVAASRGMEVNVF